MCQPYQNTTKFPDYNSHMHTILDTVATWPLYTVVCFVLCKLKLILSAYHVCLFVYSDFLPTLYIKIKFVLDTEHGQYTL